MRPILYLLPLTLAAQQPEAHWSFDGTATPERLTESYGRSGLNALEISGPSAWNTRSGFGEVLANGANAPYLSIPKQTALNPGNGDFSLSVWSYRTSNDGAAAGIVDALDNVGTGYQFFYQGDGTLRIRLDDATGNTLNADTASSQLTLNTWRHLVVTVDRSAHRARFYVNGSEVAPIGGVDISSLSGAIIPDQDLWIGVLNGNPSKGRLDDLAFFKRLLTPAEITALNASGGTPVLNVFPASAPPPAVTISPSAGILRDGETITLSSNPSTEIRYTLDGSDPDATSPTFLAPISLASSATLKARSIDGETLGPIVTSSFVRLPASPPNVLIIVADDLGFNDLGCYGSVNTSTPRLDALAAAGQRFTQFTTTGPGDIASQYALLTGRLARRGGMPDIVSPSSPALDSREWTLAEVFRKSGFATAFIGGWQLGDLSGSKPTDQGFTLFHGLPWHSGLTPPPPLLKNSSTLDPTPDPNTLLENLTVRAENFIASQATGPFMLVFQAPTLPATGSSLLGTYGNRIEALDTATGRLIDQLESQGIADQTLVLFLSDGGANRNSGTYPIGSNGQQRDGKGTTWEGGVRVPLIARWPEAIPVGDNFAVLSLTDLYPSLSEIIDGYVPPDRPIDGTNRSDVLCGARTSPDDITTLYLHRHTGTGYQLQALRSGKWKLHLSYLNTDPDNTTSTAAPLLFDLLVDPIEHVNRSTTETSTRTALQQLAAAHEATFAIPSPQLPPSRSEFLGPVQTSLATTTETSAIFSFIRPADSLDDHYILQSGNDLTGWNDLAIDPYITVSPGSDGTENIVVTVPLETLGAGSPRFFVRLKAIRP